ncbi:amino acid adenylation domain-containing protein [Streptosporangium sp. CA-115845]|uniref:amino acid adenylation domain-containing protein n=1 Tax=Streptosporangium sp. CA-115845 TaxID=3240071 RepID=UPI003D8D2FA1
MALVDGGRVWTYREVDTTVDRLVTALADVHPGEIVAVVAPRTAAGVIGILAVARAGAAFLALDPALPPARIAELIAHSGARTVLAAPEAGLSPPPETRRLDLPAEPAHSVPGRRIRAGRGDDDVAYLVYTSGTTGVPKGVVVRYGGLRIVAAEQQRILGLGPDARVYQMANVSFDAYVFELLMAFQSGGALVFPGEQGAYPGSGLVRRLHEQRVTHLVATPTALAALPPSDLPDLRVVCSVGERCTPAVRDRWSAGRRLLNLYGPAEATIWSTWTELTPDTDPATIGRPIRGTGVLVLDERREPVAAGATGELCVVGPTVALGYHRLPEPTAERFEVVPAPLVRSVITDGPDRPISASGEVTMYVTGDRVRLGEDGTLHFLGRFDDQVKINGVRLEPGESQHVLAGLPGVTEAVVVAVPADGDAVTLAAAYTGGPSPASVSARLRARLPRWAVPTRVVRLDAMPATGNGKLDIPAVRDLLIAAGDPVGPAMSPEEESGGTETSSDAADPLAELILQETRTALGTPALRLGDNFFDAGGQSMLAVRIVDRVAAALGDFLDLSELLQAPTLADWVEAVRSRSSAGSASPVGGDHVHPAQHPAVGQTEILVAEQYLLVSAAYVAAWCEKVDGAFDPDRFARALRDAAQRHEVLRTRYLMTAHRAETVVDDRVTIAEERPACPAAGLPEAVSLVERACARPYDLATEQPVRLHIVEFGQSERDATAGRRHLVTIMIHHVACDAAAIQLLLDEVWLRYRGGVVETPDPPPYSEFVARQRAFLSSAAAAEQRRWWHENLAGLSPLRMRSTPTGHDLGGARPRQGRRVPFELDGAVVRAVEAVSRRMRIGTFPVLSAAYAAALQDYATDTDCVIGSPCTVRGEPFLTTVGLFVNTLLFPLRLPAEGSLTGWLRNWAAYCSAAFARRDLPLSDVTREWRADGRPSVLFALDYTTVAPARISGRVRLDPGPVKNELLLTISRGGSTWTGELVHDLDAVAEDEATEILESFLGALDTICEVSDTGDSVAGVEVLRRVRPGSFTTAAEFDFGATTR